jgi:5'-nucleotidase
MTKVLIPDPLHVQDSIAHFVADGKEHFHVVADFDRTLTKAFVDGKPRLSLESILEQEGYLGPEYTEKSKINFDKYYPIEQDPTIPLEEKKKAMHEWRTRQFAVMLEAGLTRNIIKKAMTSKMIIFRL